MVMLCAQKMYQFVATSSEEFYADLEPLTGPQPYMHESEALSMHVEDEQAPSDGAEAIPYVS